MVPKVCEVVAGDHWMTMKLMTDRLHIKRQTINQILRKHLSRKNICATFIPNAVTNQLNLPWWWSTNRQMAVWRSASHCIHLPSHVTDLKVMRASRTTWALTLTHCLWIHFVAGLCDLRWVYKVQDSWAGLLWKKIQIFYLFQVYLFLLHQSQRLTVWPQI